MKYKQRITAVIFLMLVIPVGLRCVMGAKNFYLGIGWHLANVDTLYDSNYTSAIHVGTEIVLDGYIPWEEKWIEFYGGVQHLLDKNHIKGSNAKKFSLNDIVRLENHYLIFTNVEEAFPGEEPFLEIASRMIRFHEFLSQKNIRFLYVQAPGKVCKTDPQLPRGMEVSGNRAADILLKELNAAKVPTLDLRDEFPRGGPDYYSLFYVGDHHWNTSGALLAVQKTAAFINEHFDVKLDAEALLSERFSREDFRFRFTGSTRKRVGNFYTLPDSETLLLPIFPTRFDVQLPQERKTVAAGSFEDIWVDKSSLADGKPCYALYTKKYDTLANYINKNTHSPVRILLVGDSFIELFAPFLSLSCKENVNLEPAYYRKSIKEIVKTYQPDLVIILFSPGRKDILEIDYPL